MAETVSFEFIKELSTPNYNPRLYIILGRHVYFQSGQTFVPEIDLTDKYNPKFRMLIIGKSGKIIRKIIVDKFLDNLVTFENAKGQKAVYRATSLNDLAIIFNIISDRYKNHVITKVSDKETYSFVFAPNLFNNPNHDLCGWLGEFLDYISPGYFSNYKFNKHNDWMNESWPDSKWEKRKSYKPYKFNWPKSKWIKY